MIGGYDEIVPFITILIWKDVNVFKLLAEYLYSLNVLSLSAGVTVISSDPSPLKAIQPKLSIFLSSSAPVNLNYTSTLEVALTFCVSLTSNDVESFSSVTGLVT